MACCIGLVIPTYPKLSIFIIFGALIPLFFVKTKQLIWIVILLVLVPFNIGEIANVPAFRLYELVIPLCFGAVLINKLVKGKLSFKKNGLNLPIFIFSLLLGIHYFKNPLLPSNLLGLESSVSGFRWYYTFLLCLLVYFVIIEVLSGDKKRLYEIFGFILKLSIVMCIIGILMSITNLSIPGLSDRFHWSASRFDVRGIKFIRIGFLGFFAQLGLLLLLSSSSNISRAPKYFCFILFILGIVLSGGRIIAASTGVAFLVWCLAKKRFAFFWIVLILGLFVYLAIPYISPHLPSQLQRVINVRSLETVMAPRYYTYRFFFSKFLERPIFGTGFGKNFSIDDIPIEYKYRNFIITQVRSGGHGTYISLLYTMGIVGLASYLWILKRGFSMAIKQFSQAKDKKSKEIVLFLLLWLSATIIGNFFGGMGWNLNLYLMLGFIAVNFSSICKIEKGKNA